MDHSAHDKQSGQLKSVARALILIETMAHESREMSLTELSQKTGWPKSTLHGVLSTLREFHYVEQSHVNGHYRLGVRLFEVGTIVARSWDIRAIAKPYMYQLRDELGEMVQLGMESQGQVLYLDKIESNQLIRIVSDIGNRLPMHCSGLGKVLLAHRSGAEVLRICAEHGLPQMTSRTLTDVRKLQVELEQIRRQGYAMDDREIMDSLRCVAAPVYDNEEKVRYAISASGLFEHFQGNHLQHIIKSVCNTAKNISAAMGYSERTRSIP